ncbi:MAG: response regulator, partial [bacterium]
TLFSVEDHENALLEVDLLPSPFIGYSLNKSGQVLVRGTYYKGGLLHRISFHATVDEVEEGAETTVLHIVPPILTIASLIVKLTTKDSPRCLEIPIHGAPVQARVLDVTPENITSIVTPIFEAHPHTERIRGVRAQFVDLPELGSIKIPDEETSVERTMELATVEETRTVTTSDADRDGGAAVETKRSGEALIILKAEAIRGRVASALRELGWSVREHAHPGELSEDGFANCCDLIVLGLDQAGQHAVDWLLERIGSGSLSAQRFIIVGPSLATARENEWQELGHGLFIRENMPESWIRNRLAKWFDAPENDAVKPVDSVNPLVLAADDDPDLLESLRDLLTRRQFRIITAPDGRAALAAAHKFLPNLILLDFEMPHFNGLEVLEKLQASKETRKIPVIMLTGSGEQEAVERALGKGISDYIVKPFEEYGLIRRIRSLLANPA